MKKTLVNGKNGKKKTPVNKTSVSRMTSLGMFALLIRVITSKAL